MNLSKLGRQVFLGGAIVVCLSALVLGVEWIKHRHYQNENEKVFHALGRELSGDNARAREHRLKMIRIGRFVFGAGALAMAIGGVFIYAGRKAS
jgi:hypothetical protein